jgi:hypothetical protein
MGGDSSDGIVTLPTPSPIGLYRWSCAGAAAVSSEGNVPKPYPEIICPETLRPEAVCDEPEGTNSTPRHDPEGMTPRA